jgi:hypothetical protein
MFQAMGGKDLTRQPRLSSLRKTPAGWIRLAACNSCAHKGPLPVDQLIRKHGELALVEVVLVGLRCTQCHGYGANALILKLCEPDARGSGRTWGYASPVARKAKWIGRSCQIDANRDFTPK